MMNQIPERIQAFVREVGPQTLPSSSDLAHYPHDASKFHEVRDQFEAYSLELSSIYFNNSGMLANGQRREIPSFKLSRVSFDFNSDGVRFLHSILFIGCGLSSRRQRDSPCSRTSRKASTQRFEWAFLARTQGIVDGNGCRAPPIHFISHRRRRTSLNRAPVSNHLS